MDLVSLNVLTSILDNTISPNICLSGGLMKVIGGVIEVVFLRQRGSMLDNQVVIHLLRQFSTNIYYLNMKMIILAKYFVTTNGHFMILYWVSVSKKEFLKYSFQITKFVGTLIRIGDVVDVSLTTFLQECMTVINVESKGEFWINCIK